MVEANYQPSPADLVTALWSECTNCSFGNFIMLLASIMNLTE